MALFTAYSELVEVNGKTVLSVVHGMGTVKAIGMKYLREAGIPDVNPNGWYKQQLWLDTFRLISVKVGKSTLKAIGRSIPDHAVFPGHISDIHSALQAIDNAYKLNHRNGDIGEYRYRKITEHEAELCCINPFPSEFDEGLIETMAKRYARSGENPSVMLKINAETRRHGGHSCTFTITW